MNSLTTSRSIAELLIHHSPNSDDRAESRAQRRRALLPVAVVAALIGAWGAAAPLSGAVVAPAQLKVELNRKTVQHQEGGIVREILVRDGQAVRAGDPLVVVGDVRRDAELSLLQDQWLAARVREARAQAEASLAARFDAPAELANSDAAAAHLTRERALFGARKRALDEQSASLAEQIRQAHAQGAALQSQITASDTSARLSDEELQINETLAAQGFLHRTRLLGLERASADYRSRASESRADLASARQRAGELQARLAQLRAQYQTQASAELKEASAQTREIEEKLRPSKDHVERALVRSPVDGVVMSLRVAAAGTAIGPREPILDVLPAREKLVVEARIAPPDIDHVQVGAAADVRLATLDARSLPMLPAKVVFVSPDRVNKPGSDESWFVATVEVDAKQLERHPGLRLQAGMPAELYVKTPERSLLEYLAQPLGVFAKRAMREP